MRIVGAILLFFDEFGLSLRKAEKSIRGVPYFFRDWLKFKSLASNAEAKIPIKQIYPCLSDRFSTSGTARGHYFHQDLFVARKINTKNPELHVDVGSRVDGFVAHVASFRDIEVIDIRPLVSSVKSIKFIQADMMSSTGALVDYCDSLSSLHALEHFGLGRYGDPIDPDGHLHGLAQMHRMLKQGGSFYLSVPIGPQRIEFNAHRVFSVAYILSIVADKFRVDAFSFVDDSGDLHTNVSLDSELVDNSYGCFFGCGIFEMTKI